MSKKEGRHWRGRWKPAPFIYGIMALTPPFILTPLVMLAMATSSYKSLHFFEVIAILVILVIMLIMFIIVFTSFPFLLAGFHSISLCSDFLTVKTPTGSRKIETSNLESVLRARIYTRGFFNLHWIEIKEIDKIKPIRILHEFFDDPQLEILSELRSVVERNEFGQLATMKK